MMRLPVVLVAVTLSGCATLRPALTVGADALLWVDNAQATAILQRPKAEETNPILGHHPDNLTLAAYTAAWMAANTAAPRKVRLG